MISNPGGPTWGRPGCLIALAVVELSPDSGTGSAVRWTDPAFQRSVASCPGAARPSEREGKSEPQPLHPEARGLHILEGGRDRELSTGPSDGTPAQEVVS